MNALNPLQPHPPLYPKAYPWPSSDFPAPPALPPSSRPKNDAGWWGPGCGSERHKGCRGGSFTVAAVAACAGGTRSLDNSIDCAGRNISFSTGLVISLHPTHRVKPARRSISSSFLCWGRGGRGGGGGSFLGFAAEGALRKHASGLRA